MHFRQLPYDRPPPPAPRPPQQRRLLVEHVPELLWMFAMICIIIGVAT